MQQTRGSLLEKVRSPQRFPLHFREGRLAAASPQRETVGAGGPSAGRRLSRVAGLSVPSPGGLHAVERKDKPQGFQEQSAVSALCVAFLMFFFFLPSLFVETSIEAALPSD